MAHYLVELRKAKVTRKELAVELGVTPQTISDLLTGKNKNKKHIRMVNDYVGRDIIRGNSSGSHVEDS